jgi:cyclopropane fatty-acyl-phospholipid synthase-like methyltransferase
VSETTRNKVVFLLFILASIQTAVRGQEPPKQPATETNRLGVQAQTATVESEKTAAPKRAENLPDDINRGFLDPSMEPEEYIKRFEVESREVFAQRREIVQAIDIKPGMGIADVGAGTGLFLKPLSVAAESSGKVFAVEISPSFIKHLRKRSSEEQLDNVDVIFCSDRDANLPKNSVDRVLICDVYHHFEFPELTLKSLHAAMRPGGMIVLVDFHREPEDVSTERKQWLLGHIRAPMEVFRKEIEQAGFKFKDQVQVEGFKENYLLRFVKANGQ